MLIIVCLPQENVNYSPHTLGIIIIGATTSWFASAKYWFKGAIFNPDALKVLANSVSDGDGISTEMGSGGNIGNSIL